MRQTVSDSFAEVALGHDVSQKPLTWKRYNLSRFRTSLLLQPPEIAGYAFEFARVVEAEIRLGTWRRKLQLKVTVDDHIQEAADRYLGARNIFRRAEAFSRIAIAVAYNRIGDEKQRTLNITIAGTKSCNLQSNRDPEERSLGFALLKEWGILSAFRQIAPDDLRAIFPQLVQLHDRVEDEVSGAYLLNDPKTAQRLDLKLRARNIAGVGIVLAASEDMPSHLGPNVVMPLLSHLAPADEEMLFARDGIELAYRDSHSLARGGGSSPR